jgi:hypothetical protein
VAVRDHRPQADLDSREEPGLLPAVVVRLNALWSAWEAAKASDDGAAMSGWWVHHADPQLRTMLDAEHGPMYQCTREVHVATPPMRKKLVRPPAGWFDDPGA